MKINQIIQETTTSGAIAPVEHSFVKMQTRNPSVYGDQKVGNLFKGKKTKAPYANSLNEGAVKQLSMDLKGGPDGLTDEEFKKKYGKTKAEVRAEMKKKPEPLKPVNEADLQEDDVILVPGKGLKVKPGFHKIDPDKAEHEGQTLKNSLHTIIRVATQLDKQLSTQEHFPEWVSEKIGAVKGMITSVADYLISDEEMQHDPDAMEEGQEERGQNRLWAQITDYEKRAKATKNDIKRDHYMKMASELRSKLKTNDLEEGAKVDRMVQHIKKSEKKLGKSNKEAENIAWATANKRGMLDNKNKKAK